MIKKRAIIRPKTKTIYEVLCRHGQTHVNFRRTFDSYREAAKFVRSSLKEGQPSHRFEFRGVTRLDVFFRQSEKSSGGSRPRVIVDFFEKTWDMKVRPAKKGGVKIRS